MSKELKPCPFCGRVDSVTRQKFDTLICLYSVFCDRDKGGCGAYGPYECIEEDAIEAWNRRANENTEDNT